jgi:OOP family OmpA-OmpF porin
MQKIITKAVAVCALILGFATTSIAQDAQDVVVGPGKQPVKSEKFGTCVQTKWNAASDPCAPPAPPRRHVQAPAPKRIVQQPVSRLAREQLTIYFDFNKSAVTENSAIKLDAIADAVRHSPKVTKVDIVGHTDEIGSNEYNQKLSVARADAVKAYLDKKVTIDVGVVGLRGVGKQAPVANCDSVKKRAKKINCMAKDRRVEVEFEFQK